MAESICEALKSWNQRKGLHFTKPLAIGTENSSFMVEVNNNGVHLKLRAELPCFLLVKCVSHSLHLAVSRAAAECRQRNLEILIKETYIWFSHSAM
jgi:hypothetical protein